MYNVLNTLQDMFAAVASAKISKTEFVWRRPDDKSVCKSILFDSFCRADKQRQKEVIRILEGGEVAPLGTEILPIKAAAYYLGRDQKTVSRWAKNGDIPSVIGDKTKNLLGIPGGYIRVIMLKSWKIASKAVIYGRI